MPVLEAAILAAQQGWIQKEQFQKVFRETWSKAFPDFDLENVFWRIVYTEALFVVSSLVWRASEAYRTFMGLWEGEVAIIGGTTYSVEAGEVIAPLVSDVFPFDFYCPDGYELKRGPSAAVCALMEGGQVQTDEGPVPSVAKPMEAMIMGFLDDILVGKYFGYVLMGIPALFLLLELKNYKQRKKAKKLFGGK